MQVKTSFFDLHTFLTSAFQVLAVVRQQYESDMQVVRDVGGRFSLPHVVGVYKGDTSHQFSKIGHHKLSDFGKGQEYRYYSHSWHAYQCKGNTKHRGSVTHAVCHSTYLATLNGLRPKFKL